MGKFQVGHPRMGGRRKGQTAKGSGLVKEFFQAKNINIIEEIWSELKLNEDANVRLRTLLTLLEYICPKMRMAEVDEEGEGLITVTTENVAKLYEIARKS